MPYEIIIEPGKLSSQYWKDFWRFRGFLMFLSLGDFLVRYKQTALGVAWTFIRPFISMVVLTIVFGKNDPSPFRGRCTVCNSCLCGIVALEPFFITHHSKFEFHDLECYLNFKGLFSEDNHSHIIHCCLYSGFFLFLYHIRSDHALVYVHSKLENTVQKVYYEPCT